MKINSKNFWVQEGEKVKLKKWTTLAKPIYQSKEQCQVLIGEKMAELSALQQLHYAYRVPVGAIVMLGRDYDQGDRNEN